MFLESEYPTFVFCLIILLNFQESFISLVFKLRILNKSIWNKNTNIGGGGGVCFLKLSLLYAYFIEVWRQKINPI